MARLRGWLLGLGLCCTVWVPLRAEEPKDKHLEGEAIRVTVVVVLGSTKHDTVDKKLIDFAKQMQEIDKTLTGFTVEAVLQKSIAVGKSENFDLIDKHTLQVSIDKPVNENQRVALTVQLKEGQKVSYSCTCSKYFPMLTPIKTKNDERVIVAVMAKPCDGKGP